MSGYALLVYAVLAAPLVAVARGWFVILTMGGTFDRPVRRNRHHSGLVGQRFRAWHSRLSDLGFSTTPSADVRDAIFGAPSDVWTRIFGSRERILSELHDTAHAIRALPPGAAIRMEQMAIGAGGSQAGNGWPAYEYELDRAILRMLR